MTTVGSTTDDQDIAATLVQNAATEGEKPLGKGLCPNDLQDVWIPSDDNTVY